MLKHPAGDFKPILQKDPDVKDCIQANNNEQCFKAGEGISGCKLKSERH